MKNRILFLAVLLIAMACRREAAGDETVIKTFDCFTVSVEETEMTKAHMEDGGVVKWDVGDCIGIYSDIQEPVPYYRGSDGKFRGEPVSGNQFYAYYPFDNCQYDKDNPTVLKSISFGQMVMVAKSTTSSLAFRHVGGALHFSLQSDAPFVAIMLKGLQEESIGEGVIDFQEGEPALQSEYKGQLDKIITQCAFKQSYNDGIWHFYIPLPVMTFDSGFAVSFTGYDETMQELFVVKKETQKPISVNRGKIYSFPLIDKEEFESILEENDMAVSREKQALLALYHALDGDNWINRENWCSEKPVEEWYGVETDDVGRVKTLFLRSNRLRGEIPEEIGELTELRRLYFDTGAYGESINQITGQLPESISKLEKLQVLCLDQNKIEGLFPIGLRNLKNLNALCLGGHPDMDYPCLYGPIPEWIDELTNLRELVLFNNKLSGDIPSGFSNLSNLEVLDLNYNQLTGPLPDVSGMPRLRKVDLMSNYFTGGIPAGYVTPLNNPMFNELWLGNNCLSGEIAPEVLSHPAFPKLASMVLPLQREGYKLSIDEKVIPARRDTFKTLDGGQLNLGEEYAKARFTMIVRWAEWCMPSRGFIPTAMDLAEKYREAGLQTIWAYGGGEESARIPFMEEMGLDKWDKHIIECNQPKTYVLQWDQVLWLQGTLYSTPFVEIVDQWGNIVFIVDTDGLYPYSFSHRRSELEVFLADIFGKEEEYHSSDFSADGAIHTLLTATEGDGINIVLMGDAFSDRLVADGTYEMVMQKAVDALFSEEPYRLLKNRFNVYYVDVVSMNEVYYGETALGTWYGNGSHVGGDDDKVFKYAGNVLSDDQLSDALIIVMMNRNYYAGTCYMYITEDGDYGRGPSIAYFPTSSDTYTFNGMILHEAGGHGFAKLADEYAYEHYGTIPEDIKSSYESREVLGWYKNVDFISDPNDVKWAKFISDDRYSSEGISVYEGACTFWIGAWRPTEDSIMRYNVGGFNAPSREAIYYRAMKLSEGPDWEYDYETFVAFDMSSRATPAATTSSAQTRPRNYVERPLPPLPPPVVVNKDWREVRK